MTQNNLYMDEENMRLYVDVQPLFIDELENSKNIAVSSAQTAQQSAQNVQTCLNSIISYKTNIELFYAQSIGNLTDYLNNILSAITNAKNNALSGIQDLKNSVIFSIQTTGQNIINQIIGIASDVQNTIDDGVSADYLVQSNAIKSGGVSENSRVLPCIKSYAHSTFDASKFTVAGSPIVTNDGIASGFSSGNYLSINQANTYSNDFEMVFPDFVLNAYTHNEQNFITIDNYRFILKFWQSTDLSLVMTNSNGTTFSSSNAVTGLSTGVKYSTKLVYKNGVYNFYIKGGSYTDWTSTWNLTSADKAVINGTLRIGLRSDFSDKYFEGNADLPQFSITVDGVPVFSGNKTGIDTIKADDYTKVTTLYAWVYDGNTIYADSSTAPTQIYNADGSLYTQSASTWQIVVVDGTTYVQYNGNNATYTSGSNITLTIDNDDTVDASVIISDDGIASNFGGGRTIQGFNLAQLKGKSFRIEAEVTLPDGGTGNLFYPLGIQYSNVSFGFEYAVASSDRAFRFHRRWGTTGSGNSGSTVYTPVRDGTNGANMHAGDVYELYYELIFPDVLKFGIRKKGTTSWIERTETDTTYLTGLQCVNASSNSTVCRIGGSSLKNNVNLNSYKVYANGDLVYQPCLKIPYTESKTGSKIVNSIYRDRVNDMAEQFGFAPYYTLGENDFTLPAGEIYGMIENLRKLIIQRTS